jgi:glucose-6-phosphate isomerase
MCSFGGRASGSKGGEQPRSRPLGRSTSKASSSFISTARRSISSRSFITVVREKCAGTGPRVAPDLAKLAGAGYLSDCSAGDLVAAQQRAIPEALIEAGRPVRTIDLERLDERALGALMMHFMLETILAAHLPGIDPFDQPAVESGKILTRRYLAGEKTGASDGRTSASAQSYQSHRGR